MESLSCRGLWWVPNRRDHRIPGFLNFSPDKASELQVFGKLMNGRDLTNIPVIQGAGSNGEQVTLSDCILVGESLASGGVVSETYYAKQCYVGRHFDSAKDIRFARLDVYYEDLDIWSALPTFRWRQSKRGRKVSVTHTPQHSVGAKTAQVTVDINPLATYTADYLGAHLSHNAVAKLTSHSARPFIEWQRLAVFPLLSLLSLAFARRESVIRIDGFSTAEESDRDSVRIYVETWVSGYKRDASRRPDLVFSLEEVKREFSTVIDKWFHFCHHNEDIVRLREMLRSMGDSLKEFAFLGTVQVLESYHRRRYGKHATLRKRLTQLLEDADIITKHFVNDKDEFVALIVDTRNYYTHCVPSRRQPRTDLLTEHHLE